MRMKTERNQRNYKTNNGATDTWLLSPQKSTDTSVMSPQRTTDTWGLSPQNNPITGCCAIVLNSK